MPSQVLISGGGGGGVGAGVAGPVSVLVGAGPFPRTLPGCCCGGFLGAIFPGATGGGGFGFVTRPVFVGTTTGGGFLAGVGGGAAARLVTAAAREGVGAFAGLGAAGAREVTPAKGLFVALDGFLYTPTPTGWGFLTAPPLTVGSIT